MILLKNNTKQIRTVNLPHDLCEKDACKCDDREHRSLVLDGKTGDTAIKISRRRINPSVHLIPGEWSEPLPNDVVKCPEIASLIGKGIETKAAEKKDAAPATTPAPSA